MMTQMRATALLLQYLMQRVSYLLLLSLGLGLGAYSAAAALGYVNWLTMPLTFGDQVVPQAGIYIQLGLTVLALGLMFFLPSNARIMTLENSHRRFHMTMRDVARAYSASHRADREGVFTLSSEFDSVRERIAHLRDHPDLGDLEPSVLEAAAQIFVTQSAVQFRPVQSSQHPIIQPLRLSAERLHPADTLANDSG